MNRSMVKQMALSALIFFLVFRLLSFLGLGFLLVLALAVGAWYLVRKRPDLIERGKAWVTARRPRAPRMPRPAPRAMKDKPLKPDERAAFENLARDFDRDRDPDGPGSPR